MKILLTGDVHVGRASSAIPGIATGGLLAASAWQRIVDLAINEGVAAVLISGDLVERSNKYFEAPGPIEAGLRKLSGQNIRTIAVAGNHDYDILPRLADEFVAQGLRFELLGRNGQWTETTVTAGERSVTVIGWSFPSAEVREHPVKTAPVRQRGAHPTIGLVHGDLGATSSKYAPLDASELTGTKVDGWLLGHIHAPKLQANPGSPWILYPGSPQALDPGETGVHGAWIVEATAGSVSSPIRFALSTARYERRQVSLQDCDDELSAQAAIDGALRQLADQAREEGGGHLSNLVVDLEVEGETLMSPSVPDMLERLEAFSTGGSVEVHARSRTDLTSIPLDLTMLSGASGLPGMLARAIVDLEAGRLDAPEAKSLMQRVLPLMDSLPQQMQSTEFVGDSERRATLEETFFRKEALKSAKAILAAITRTPRERANA